MSSAQHLRLTIKTVSRPKDATGFVVLPRRWVVERTLAWLMHARRHARDYERLVQHSEALITLAAITLMTRRITQKKKPLTDPDPDPASRYDGSLNATPPATRTPPQAKDNSRINRVPRADARVWPEVRWPVIAGLRHCAASVACHRPAGRVQLVMVAPYAASAASTGWK